MLEPDDEKLSCPVPSEDGFLRIPSKRESSARVDYVPALCTHRPSLLPIEWSGEVFGSRRRGRFAAGDVARSPLNLII